MANNKTFRVSLDMKAPTAQRNEWEVVEGDNGNIIEITLTDDGEPVDLTGCKVLAVFGLPTGVTVEQDTDEGSVTIGGDDNNVITIALKTGSFSPGKSSSGLMKCEIQVYSGADLDVLVTSAQFTFRCRRAIINDETVAATDEYPILVELINEVAQIEQNWQADWNQADVHDHSYIKNKPGVVRYDTAQTLTNAQKRQFVSNAGAMRVYTSVTELGLTSGSATIAGCYAAMVNQTMLICDGDELSAGERPEPTGVVEIVRNTWEGRGHVWFHAKGGNDYRMSLNSSNELTGIWFPCVRTYTSVTQLGLTSGSATIAGVLGAMDSETQFMGEYSDFSASELPSTGWQGTIFIQRINSWRIAIFAYGQTASFADYRMKITGSNTPSGIWNLIADAVIDYPQSGWTKNVTVDSTATLKRYGSMCVLTLVCSGVSVTTGWGDALIAIPAALIPAYTVTCAGKASSAAIDVRISSDSANVQVRGSSALSNQTVRFQLTWFI